MAVYYVSISTGSDANDGLAPETAWATLSKAAATLVAGDDVYIAPGIYREQVEPASAGADGMPIRFLGDPRSEHFPGVAPGEVVITGADETGALVRQYGFLANGKPYIELTGLVAKDVLEDGFRFDGASDHLAVARCKAEANEHGLIVLYPVVGVQLTDLDAYGGECGIQYDPQSGTNLDASGWLLERCVATGGSYGLRIRAHSQGRRFHDAEIKHCAFSGGVNGAWLEAIYYTTSYQNEIASVRFLDSSFQGGANGLLTSTTHGTYARNRNHEIIGCKAESGVDGFNLTMNGAIEACLAKGRSGFGIKAAGWNADNCVVYDSAGSISAATAIGCGAYRVAAPGEIQVFRSLIEADPPAGIFLDQDLPIAGSQSAKLRVPLLARHVFQIAVGALDATPVPITVRLLARKNFAGGQVVFSFGDAQHVLADNQEVQEVQLTHVPEGPGLLDLTVLASTDAYTRADAVWIDTILVS